MFGDKRREGKGGDLLNYSLIFRSFLGKMIFMNAFIVI